MATGLHHCICFAAHRTPYIRCGGVAGRPEQPFFDAATLLKISRLFPAERAARFLRRSASLSGSGAEYTEQLLGMPQHKKRRTVADVDQEELVDPGLLADPDSFFCDFNGVQIHHKIYHNEEHVDQSIQVEDSSQLPDGKGQKIRLPMILLHGFGASVFSWGQVMKPLARLTGSKVLAFDRPAFGLTSRTKYFGDSNSGNSDATPLNPYSMAFSVMATLSFIDLLGTPKAILMGHSAGCQVAANAYFEDPDRVAALILVAPAIVAPFIQRKDSNGNKVKKQTQTADDSKSDVQKKTVFRIWKRMLGLFTGLAWVAMQIMKGIKNMVHILYKTMLSAVLRSSFAVMVVRIIMDKFGILGVKNAWYDAKKVTDHVIQGYTKPLKAKGWEMALLEYTLAMLTDSSSESKPPQTRRLAEIKCPVLIVTGDTDRLVPSWNAKRLSAIIPGATFEEIKNCGHLPHEERVEEFLSVVNKFLQRVVGPQGAAINAI